MLCLLCLCRKCRRGSNTLANCQFLTGLIAHAQHPVHRMSRDEFREISGWLLNAKRRNREELATRNPNWDFSGLASEVSLAKLLQVGLAPLRLMFDGAPRRTHCGHPNSSLRLRVRNVRIKGSGGCGNDQSAMRSTTPPIPPRPPSRPAMPHSSMQEVGCRRSWRMAVSGHFCSACRATPAFVLALVSPRGSITVSCARVASRCITQARHTRARARAMITWERIARYFKSRR